MKITISSLKEKFQIFNKQYFDNLLNINHIDLYIKNDMPDDQFGYVNYNFNKGIKMDRSILFNNKMSTKINNKRIYINRSNYHNYMRPIISINKNITDDENFTDKILIHEMVYLYCCMLGYFCDHDGLFKKVADGINKITNNKFEISEFYKK